MVKIVLDSGHGGFGVTPGKRSPDGEFEWDFNNKQLRYCQSYLEQYENVQILRVDDASGRTDVPLRVRTDKSNAFGAEAYISFHNNANTSRWGDWSGTETFTYLGSNPKSEKLQNCIHPLLVETTGIKDRGKKKADYHVLRETDCAAVLLESFFMDSVIDIKKLRDESYLKATGEAVARGIASYFGLKKKQVVENPIPVPQPGKVRMAKVIYRGSDGVNIRNKENFDKSSIVGVARYGDAFTIVEERQEFYKLKSGLYITKSPTYVSVIYK